MLPLVWAINKFLIKGDIGQSGCSRMCSLSLHVSAPHWRTIENSMVMKLEDKCWPRVCYIHYQNIIITTGAVLSFFFLTGNGVCGPYDDYCYVECCSLLLLFMPYSQHGSTKQFLEYVRPNAMAPVAISFAVLKACERQLQLLKICQHSLWRGDIITVKKIHAFR